MIKNRMFGVGYIGVSGTVSFANSTPTLYKTFEEAETFVKNALRGAPTYNWVIYEITTLVRTTTPPVEVVQLS